jgi:hypothetical protein
MKYLLILLLLPLAEVHSKNLDYLNYHQEISQAEKFISEERYDEAFEIFEEVIGQYDFVFLKHYKIAAQLALHLDQADLAYDYVQLGMASGWTIKEIKKNSFLAPLWKEKDRWTELTSSYELLHSEYLTRINSDMREEVRDMFRRDQWLAFKALFHFGEKQYNRYAENKFAPQSERHMARLDAMLDQYGYPGEKHIGIELWSYDMILHHVSMTTEYTRQDTIFYTLSPKLKKAIRSGEMSPYSYAFIYDWYTAVKSSRAENSFGYVNELSRSYISKSNDLRADLGMRSIEVRHGLVDIQEKTGMDFFLEGKIWMKEKLSVTDSMITDRQSSSFD